MRWQAKRTEELGVAIKDLRRLKEQRLLECVW